MATSKQKKSKGLVVGNIVQILLSDGNHGYGRILVHPLMAFYGISSMNLIDCAEIIASPIAFKVWVMDSAVTSGRWKVVGNAPLEPEHEVSPCFFKQDAISKKLSLYRHGVEGPATLEECEGLERAAVWSAEHVERRLEDYFAGRNNKSVEALQAKK